MRRYLENPPRDEGMQAGVSGLATGDHMTINKPEGWEQTHQRGREDEAEKRGKRNFADDYS